MEGPALRPAAYKERWWVRGSAGAYKSCDGTAVTLYHLSYARIGIPPGLLLASDFNYSNVVNQQLARLFCL